MLLMGFSKDVTWLKYPMNDVVLAVARPEEIQALSPTLRK